MRKLFFALVLLLIGGAYSEAGAQPQCIGIGCGTDNKCTGTQGSSNRNCCCQPVCGPFGCNSCLQSCWTACSISCAAIVCPNCTPQGGGGGFAEAQAFIVPPGSVDAAWKKHLVAGIVMHGRSVTPQGKPQSDTKNIYTEMIRGGTSLYGHQVGFDVNIITDPQHLRLDIVFDAERSDGPLPQNVRFEVDSMGTMTVVDLPADGFNAIQQKQAVRKLSCEQVLMLAMTHP